MTNILYLFSCRNLAFKTAFVSCCLARAFYSTLLGAKNFRLLVKYLAIAWHKHTGMTKQNDIRDRPSGDYENIFETA